MSIDNYGYIVYNINSQVIGRKEIGIVLIVGIFKKLQNRYRHRFILRDCRHSCLACKFYKSCVNETNEMFNKKMERNGR